MVTRTRLARTGESGSLEKSRLPKSKIELFLEKRMNQKHLEGLKKVEGAVKEVGKTSAWVIREGGKALGDMLSMKYYWEAMDSFEKKTEPQKLAQGLEFQKTMQQPTQAEIIEKERIRKVVKEVMAESKQ